MSNVLLVVMGATILGSLGLIHLIYTFHGERLDPRDPAAIEAMKATHPRLTRATTVWKAWIGFNASHSLGAILFAGVYLTLAAEHPGLLAQSKALILLALAAGLAYLALAVKYWFRIPLTGIALATTCFAIAALRLFL
jgi:hypothetical protein